MPPAVGETEGEETIPTKDKPPYSKKDYSALNIKILQFFKKKNNSAKF